MTQYPDHTPIAQTLLDQQTEINRLTTALQTAQADRATVLTNAADRLHTYAHRNATTPPCPGWAGAEDFLRWLAKEAPAAASNEEQQ